MTVREMTTREIETFKSGHCPACGGKHIHEGPSGGASQNVFCANPKCRAGWNLMLTPWGLMGGQLIRDPISGDKLDALAMSEDEREYLKEPPTGGKRDRDMLQIYGIVSFVAGVFAMLGLIVDGWIVLVVVFVVLMFWYFVVKEAYSHFGVERRTNK